MALIKCPECDKEISDTVKVCPGCGYKFKKAKKIKVSIGKKKKIIVMIVFAALLFATGGFLSFKYYFIPLGNYNAANDLVDNHKYDEAIEEFKKLDGFKNSREKVLETHYKKAEYFLESNSYKGAVSEFEAAGKYKDALDRVKATKYLWAENATLDEAVTLYEELGDYKNSKAKLVAVKEKQNEKIAIEKISHAYALCVSDTTKMATDKKSITVDSFGKYDLASLMDVETIISTLELPDSLYDEMCATNALMGRQRETYDNFDISWSYHPDSGLDVIFKYNKNIEL